MFVVCSCYLNPKFTPDLSNYCCVALRSTEKQHNIFFSYTKQYNKLYEFFWWTDLFTVSQAILYKII